MAVTAARLLADGGSSLANGVGDQAPAPAVGEAAGFVDRKGSTSLRTGLGFTLNPDGFLLGLELSHFLGHHVALGPLLQFAVSDDEVLLAPTANVRGVFDIAADGLENPDLLT
jgi:hypothetical protein